MKYDVKWLIEHIAQGGIPKYLFFWGLHPCKNGELTPACFGQTWMAAFTVEGVTYPTLEHWMKAQKALLFRDHEIFRQIPTATCTMAKSLGRQVRGFNDATWVSKRPDLLVQGTFHKFSQSPELKQFLLSTKDQVLVNACPVDNILGIGMAADSKQAENPSHWKGPNLSGFALMEARDMLLES